MGQSPEVPGRVEVQVFDPSPLHVAYTLTQINMGLRDKEGNTVVKRMIHLILSTPAGINNYTFDSDFADRLGDNLKKHAMQARTGLLAAEALSRDEAKRIIGDGQ
jgi:hypothetical protein